jgi:hypothetical protein
MTARKRAPPVGHPARDVASSNMTLYGPKQRSAFHLAAPAWRRQPRDH